MSTHTQQHGLKRPAEVVRGTMRYRALGRTGEWVSAIGLGGFHLGLPDGDHEAVSIVRRAIERGVTFLDNSWDYHDGLSERRMGLALRDGWRERVFLMTKIDGRTRAAAARQIDESLARLGTDRIDLLQHHEVIRMEDPDRIFAPDGAHAAVLAAQQAGKVRYVGFTGHKDPLVHLRMLEVAAAHGVRFDAVQMPLNLLDAHFRSFERHVLPVLVEDEVAVLGMKPLCSGALLETGVVSATEGLHYALDLPTSVVITGVETEDRLDQALEAVWSWTPLEVGRRAELLERTADAARAGQHESFKTRADHDATAKHPEWLG